MQLQIIYLVSDPRVWKAGNEELARVNIQRGIFQVDTLSLSLFVISLNTVNHILRKVMQDTELVRGSTKRSITFSLWMI